MNKISRVKSHVKATELSEIKEREEHLSTLLANLNVIILEGDPDHITYIGGNVEGILGYTKEEWLSCSDKMTEFWSQHIHPDDREEAVEHCLRATREGRDHVLEYRMISKDGRVIWFQDTITVEVHDGVPVRARAVMTDITERKQVEEIHRENESRYRSLFEDSPISLWAEDLSQVKKHLDSLKELGVKDFRTYFDDHPDELVHCASLVRVIDINKTTLHLFEAESKEVLFKDLNLVFTEDSYRVFKEGLIHFCKGETIFNADSVNKKLSGEQIDISITWCLPPGFEHNWGKIFISIIDISERKQAEEALRESERQYRLLFDSANEGIGVIQGAKFCFVNSKLTEICGYSEEELLSLPVFDFTLPEDRPMLVDRLKRRLAGKEVTVDFDFRIIAKDNSIRWLNANAVRIEWDGKPATLNFLADVTERKEMEDKIKTAARQWDTTFDAINDGISLLDTDRKVMRTNKALAKLIGKPLEEITGQHCNSLLECSHKTCPFDRMLKSRKRETEVVPFGDSWFEGTIDPIFNENGELTGAVHYLSDITERRWAGEQIRRQNEFLNTIMESLTHPFYIVDVNNYKVVMANPAAQKRISSPHTTCYELSYNRDKPCDGSQHPCPILEVTKTKKPVTVEHAYGDRDGNKKNLEIHAYPIFNDKGEVIQIIEYIIDITERRQVEELARVQQKQLLQADKMITLGILVSGVAHEINNPNNSITLNAQFLEKSWQSILPILEEYYKEDNFLQIGGIPYERFRENTPFLFSGILDSSKRIQHIVGELKEFSRKDTGDINITVDLNSAAESAVGLLNNIIKESTHHFEMRLDKQLPSIMGDFRKLEQVIINLVQNSCQALTSPAQRIVVSTCYDPKHRQVILKVTDEGVGIKKEDLKYIKEPFFTTRRGSGGTGLGLSVSSRIIDDHGGTLQFKSETGKGTTTEIRFPVYEKETIKGGKKNDG